MIALGVLPGMGHIRLGRTRAGVALFALFAASANGVLVASFWQGPEAAPLRLASEGAAAAVWALAMALLLRLTIFTDRAHLCERRDESLRAGIVLALRGDDRGALARFHEARSCDVDDDDADVLFHLGACCARLGRTAEAESWWRRCVASCPRHRFEIDRERARIRAVRAARDGSTGATDARPHASPAPSGSDATPARAGTSDLRSPVAPTGARA